MVNRRDFFGITLGAGAALALTPELLRALQQPGGKLIQRAIPSSGEMLPVIGLSFGEPRRVRGSRRAQGGPQDARRQRRQSPRRDARRRRARSSSTPRSPTSSGFRTRSSGRRGASPPAVPSGPPQPGPARRESADRGVAREVQGAAGSTWSCCPSPSDPTHLAVLKEVKKEGRVRYIGVQAIGDNQYAAARGDHAQRADRLHRRRLRHRQSRASRRRSCRSPRSGRSA